VPQALPIVDSLADPEIELIINLTTPDVHGEVGLAALRVDPENQQGYYKIKENYKDNQ